MDERSVVAIGGAGFEAAGLVGYLLELTRKERPKVCFLPTASGDANEHVVTFYRAFAASRCEPVHLPLFKREVADVEGLLLAQDAIYVGGGNTANMLAVWRLHGVDRILRAAWEAGILLCGSSAGANCWFEACVTDSFGLDLAPLEDGLGLLAGSFCPHWDSEEKRKPTYRHLVAGGFPPGIAADDAVGVRFQGAELAEVVAAREGAAAYRVEPGAETALPGRRLGA